MGAATALALALVLRQGGAALADDSITSVPTPVGTLVAGTAPDGSAFGVGFVGAGPAGDLPPVEVSLGRADPDAQPAGDGSDSHAPAAPSWRERSLMSLVSSVLPLLLGTAGTTPAPDAWMCAGPGCGAASSPAAAARPGPARPLTRGPIGACGLGATAPVPACADGLALVDTVSPALDTPGLSSVPAAGPMPAAPPAATPRVPASGLAGTGAPIVAALAGLVLLVVGGLLTWARARG